MSNGDKSTFINRFTLCFECNALLSTNLRGLGSLGSLLFLPRELCVQLSCVLKESVTLIEIRPAKRFNFADWGTEILLGLEVDFGFYETHSTGTHSRKLRALGFRVFRWLFVLLWLVTGQVITRVGEWAMEVWQRCPLLFESRHFKVLKYFEFYFYISNPI